MKIKKENEFHEEEVHSPNNLDRTTKQFVFKRYAVLKIQFFFLKNETSIKIAVVTVGETFGEEELIEKTKRKSCVRCTSSSGELYMLNRKVLKLKKKNFSIL